MFGCSSRRERDLRPSCINDTARKQTSEATKKCAKRASSKKNNMNKQGIAEAVHNVLNGTKVQAEQVVDTVFDSIVASLKKGEEVSIAGIGIFSVKQRAARQARNPRTGEAISVPAMKVPKFRAAKALKESVK